MKNHRTIICTIHGETEAVLKDALLLRYECKACKEVKVSDVIWNEEEWGKYYEV